jgi:transposase InsO family protein
VLFWDASDLERKLAEFRQYYNLHRCHSALDGTIPSEASGIRRSPLLTSANSDGNHSAAVYTGYL